MRTLALIPLLLSCASLRAEIQPQFTWEGEVDGTSILFLRGKRLWVEDRKGLPVQSQRYHFYSPLPDSHQSVRLEVRGSRGAVQITQQPRLENDYTLAITIEDPQSGASTYSIALFWDTNRGAVFSDGRSDDKLSNTDQLTWSGRVDGEVTVECHGRACRATGQRDGSVIREQSHFSRSLPDSDVRVSLDNKEGRGPMVLLEQPNSANHYTAKVLIRDSGAGSADYSFTLTWERPSRRKHDRP